MREGVGRWIRRWREVKWGRSEECQHIPRAVGLGRGARKGREWHSRPHEERSSPGVNSKGGLALLKETKIHRGRPKLAPV